MKMPTMAIETVVCQDDSAFMMRDSDVNTSMIRDSLFRDSNYSDDVSLKV